MEYLDINVETTINDSLQKLNDYTNLTFLSPGSKVRSIIEILGEELGIEAEKLDSNVGAPLIRKAKGVMLDFLGEMYGLQRKMEQKAELFSEEENFVLYTLAPSFGDINAGEDIIIGVGQINVYNTLDKGPAQIVYTNTERIILPRNQNKIYFSATAREAGAKSNTGARTLNFHDFTNYADSLNRTLLVTNNESITYGSDTESDDNFRYRIQKEKISAEAGNETAIRLGILMVPGVADVVRIPYARGVGTTDWLIKSISPVAPESLILAVQTVVDSIQSTGTGNIVRSPNIVGLEMSFPLKYKGTLQDRDKDKIKAEVRKKISDYVNNLNIGENLIIDQIVRIVLNSSDQIESMGDPNSSGNFSKLYVHKRSGYSNSITRKSLVGDYKAKKYERVILEPKVEAPIVIRDIN